MGRPRIAGLELIDGGGAPRWANGGSAAVVEPLPGDKTLGWVVDEEPPAPWFNWFQRQMYRIQAATMTALIQNWFTKPPPAGFTGSVILANPKSATTPNRIVCISGTDVSWSDTANITSGWGTASLSNSAIERSKAVDSLRFIVGVAGGANSMRVEYSVSAESGSWNVASISNGSAELTTAIATSEISDRIIICSAFGDVHFASDVTQAFTRATTEPTNDPISAVVHVRGTVWMLTNDLGAVYISTDDGVNWALTSGQPTAPDSFGYQQLVTDLGSFHTPARPDRIILSGGAAGLAQAEYTEDDGATWVPCVFGPPSSVATGPARALWYCGAGLWVTAGGTVVDPVAQSYLAVSADNGANFRRVSKFAEGDQVLSGVTPRWLDIACDGERIWVANTQGELAMSLAIAAPPELSPP